MMGQENIESLNLDNFRKYEAFNKVINKDSLDRSLLELAVFFATNEQRVKHKLPEVSYNDLLAKAARNHSEDMARLDFFNHENKFNKKRKEPTNRCAEVGIANPIIAENIAEGFIIEYEANVKVLVPEKGVFVDQKTDKILPNRTYLQLADNLVDRWMNSPGHRTNILSTDAKELGCGIALFYMTDFNEMPAVKATQNFQLFQKVTELK